MTNRKPKARKPATKQRVSRAKTKSEQVRAAMLSEALSGSAAAAKLYLRMAGEAPASKSGFDIEVWTAHVGTEWEELAPPNLHMLNEAQRVLVEEAIAAKKAALREAQNEEPGRK